MCLKKISPVFSIILLFSIPCLAQDKWEWPEHPTNIKVLPADVTAAQLRETMHEFTSGLGVRCIYCHKGAEGKPFTEWDFASDEKQDKETAREMMRMLHDIDAHLAKIEPDADSRLNVTCYTCHHGRPKPMTLDEEIRKVYRKEGLEPALTHLSELKEEYYGKGIYNFESDQVLNEFGHSLLDSSKTDEALRVLKLNVEKFPGSSAAWSGLAAAYMQSGDKAEAIKSFEKSLELNPRNRYAKKMLDKIKE
jgi:tetratricopeptide (TPR) repeat protein